MFIRTLNNLVGILEKKVLHMQKQKIDPLVLGQ